MLVATVSAARLRAHAELTVESAHALGLGQVTVLDLDGTFLATGRAQVIVPDELGLTPRELHRRLATGTPAAVTRGLLGELAQHLRSRAARDTAVLALAPGVLLLGEPAGWLELAAGHRAARAPGDGEAPSGGPGLVAIAVDAPDDAPTAVADDPALYLGPATLTSIHQIAEAGPGLLLDGRPVVAVDLSGVDPARPWLFDADHPGRPAPRLSDHPHLATFVAARAAQMRRMPPAADPFELTSLGVPLDDTLRAALAAGPDAPDPFDESDAQTLRRWLVGPQSAQDPGPYLQALHRGRPDLVAAFPEVPGRDTDALLRWAAAHGRAEGLVPALLPTAATPPRAGLRARAAAATDLVRSRVAGRRTTRTPRPEPGVTVVGFLRGELGVGESARLVVAALEAAGIPCSTVALTPSTGTRNAAPFTPTSTSQAVREVTVLCVNADLTPSVAASLPDHLDRSHRIGMWYWEVEDFPDALHGAFRPLDEVWVATDFMRDAIEPHSPVPVRTVTPPLPQRGPEPRRTRADLGLPDGRPVLLFSFDFLSTAERKNPWGLVEAFRRAFAPDEGPVLVVKSINAERRPADAERLRVAALGRPDVLLFEHYLDAESRDALVAHCDAYVSLHRSEGLGLTMAEAMAWGKPVIATGYSGNLQFMTDENSFLVPWTPARIPEGAAPYPAGGRWAQPDLDEAARLMRLVVEDSDDASRRGARAAQDIATVHSPAASGVRIRAALTPDDRGPSPGAGGPSPGA